MPCRLRICQPSRFCCCADGGDLAASSGWVQYVASVYWATETITTVGYGDITPISTAERIVAMFVMLLGECLQPGMTAHMRVTNWVVQPCK